MPTTTHPQPDTTRNPQLTVGLTGGIGSGKTVAADMFANLGVSVIDADLLARELVEPGKPALAAIVTAFGTGILSPDGALDRAALRQLVFSNPDMKQRLEEILHPPIRTLMQARLASATSAYAIAVIPLLLETGQTGMVDRILVIDTPESIQRKRVAERDGLSDNVINDILESQATRESRLAAADDIIVNDRDLDMLRDQIRKLHEDYLERVNANRAG